MEKSEKDPAEIKRGKITRSLLITFFIVFVAGALLSISASLNESFRIGAVLTMLIASSLFIISILRQAKSAIRTEERIDDLENRVGKLENSTDTLLQQSNNPKCVYQNTFGSFNAIKKVGSKQQFLILILISAVVLGVLTYYNQETITSVLWDIQEDRVYDPSCMMESVTEDSDPSVQGYCKVEGNESESMLGLSYYYETKSTENNLRFLALKIKVPGIPQSSPFSTTEIKFAKIQLHTRYDATENDPLGTEVFSIQHGLCDDTSWTEEDTYKELTCLSEYKTIISKISTHDGTIDAKFIQSVDLDISTHLQYALLHNMSEYTETVQFYPLSVLKDKKIDAEVTNCLEKIGYISERRNCVERYQIHLFTTDYPKNFELQPKLFLEYTTAPTSLANSLQVVSLTLLPVFGTSMLYLRHQRLEHYQKMRTVCKSLKKEINDTYDMLKDHPKYGKLIDKFNVPYDQNSKLTITFNEKFNNEILLHDAYDGVKNTGLLYNFKEENLIEIITFYNQIKNYNENLNRLFDIKQKATIEITSQNVNNLKWKYETEIKTLAEHLGKSRNTILKKINDRQNGITKILEDEVGHYS